jgi:hypothetical protein
MPIFGERHLRSVLARYAVHYNRQRPHRALQLRPPRPESPVPEPIRGKIQRRPILGGLITTRPRPETTGHGPRRGSGTRQDGRESGSRRGGRWGCRRRTPSASPGAGPSTPPGDRRSGRHDGRIGLSCPRTSITGVWGGDEFGVSLQQGDSEGHTLHHPYSTTSRSCSYNQLPLSVQAARPAETDSAQVATVQLDAVDVSCCLLSADACPHLLHHRQTKESRGREHLTHRQMVTSTGTSRNAWDRRDRRHIRPSALRPHRADTRDRGRTGHC